MRHKATLNLKITRPMERLGAQARIVGHRELSPDINGNGEVEPMEWTKQCPCFEVDEERW